jgi:hypothetical protein
MPEPPEPRIYQLRAVLLGISPIIWRRLFVLGDSTIADLHVTLQTADPSPLRFRVITVDQAETLRLAFRRHALTDDHLETPVFT